MCACKKFASYKFCENYREKLIFRITHFAERVSERMSMSRRQCDVVCDGNVFGGAAASVKVGNPDATLGARARIGLG